jgi:hypothetical protein
MKLPVLAVAAAAAAIVGCAGCGVSPVRPTTAPGLAAVRVSPTASASPVAGQSAGHNRAATGAEVKRLLALAPLPPGVRPVKGPQRKLDGPAMGTPSTSSLIDRHGFWQSSMPMSTVWSFINAHAPNRLTTSGSSSGNDGDGPTEGIGWGEPDTAYATGLELDVSVIANAGGTLIRADGLGEWLDPRPIRDSGSGPRLRVTVAGGCPSIDKSVAGVSNPGPGLDDALLPAGSPIAGLICEYGGLNSTPRFGLAKQVDLDSMGAVRIASQARALPVDHTDAGVHSCPMDDGSFDVIALRYAGRPDVDLGYHSTGCETVANGHILVNGGLTLNR